MYGLPFLLKQSDHSSKAGRTITGAEVVELGCGPGTVVLITAALGAEAVVLTDIDEAVLGLAYSTITSNRRAATCIVARLAWGEAITLGISLPADIVVASYLLYQPSALPSFTSTLVYLSDSTTPDLILLGLEEREALLFPLKLFQSAGFQVDTIHLCE